MRILNLYAGLGGNRKYWMDDMSVTAVELEPQIADVYRKQFPQDKLIVGDAHQYLLEHHKEFDFIWSSPPCQSHTRMMKATRHDVAKYPDMTLYQEIIFLQNFFKGRWVVENVVPYYSLLIQPEIVMDRHCFWSNFHITGIKIQKPDEFIYAGNTEDTDKLKKWLGIEYDGNIYYKDNHCPGQVLRNCVHPTIGNHILNCCLGLFCKEEEFDLFKEPK